MLGIHAFLLAVLLLGQPSDSQEASLDQLLEGMRQSQSEDLDAWAEYRFHRIVIREQRNSSGQVLGRVRWDFQVKPHGEGFDELLVLADGQPPSDREVKHHRKKARFTKHYGQVRTDAVQETDQNSFPFHRLLYMPSYRYEGTELLGGVQCHVLSFEPFPEKEDGDLADRFSSAMSGTLWVTTEGFHLYKASARTKRSLSMGFGLAKIHSVSVEFRGAETEPGVWLPSRIEVKTNGRILASTFYKRNLYLYQDFERAGVLRRIP